MADEGNALERKKPKRGSTITAVNNRLGANGLSKG
jgi:hypothetical protein